MRRDSREAVAGDTEEVKVGEEEEGAGGSQDVVV